MGSGLAPPPLDKDEELLRESFSALKMTLKRLPSLLMKDVEAIPALTSLLSGLALPIPTLPGDILYYYYLNIFCLSVFRFNIHNDFALRDIIPNINAVLQLLFSFPNSQYQRHIYSGRPIHVMRKERIPSGTEA